MSERSNIVANETCKEDEWHRDAMRAKKRVRKRACVIEKIIITEKPRNNIVSRSFILMIYFTADLTNNFQSRTDKIQHV